ncbi:F420-dependent NADP oxidoreductase [Lachnoclostridium pacaense]|uniref:phosphogluconate dehydrogenase C-terminal domain-containing protein n=1 Tax=Enterocloster hominis (ex Hitch et al. 2024) TaxID=1917870 RepID=UPI001D12C203|nr:phosphogluconate dehydrogenase C-terminal domain-containing protein [Lachnoclostridium pacaense]MCC2820211.1 F420-dependent NADP oxidoreductase [Lachnoclostridium pacaense]
MSRIKVSVIGAGGKMGTRTSNNLALKPDEFELMMAEASEAGIRSIRERGFEPVSVEEALEQSDVVVFAVPDTLIKKLSTVYVPKLRPGTGFIILDPAAAVAKELALRDDCTFAVAHPCHPSYFIDQDTYEARQDRFGGCGGKQDIVMSKIQGDDDRFAQCVEVAKQMYAPVEHAYVMTSEQIAFLEPTLVELLGATCLYAMAETVDEAERRGIDRDAAVSFLTGHIYNLSANFLGYIPGKPPVSDACKVAIGLGNRLVMREDWKQIWDDGILNKVIATMLHPEKPQI